MGPLPFGMGTEQVGDTSGAPVAADSPAPPPTLTTGSGVMVVDDTPSALRLMVELLGRNGYSVRPASSGELALRSASRQVPELILLDVQMPGLDGYEVCRRLKADPKTASVPVIFLSALRDTTSRVEGLEAGAVDFISKPFQAEEVLARVRAHLLLGRTMNALDQMCAHLEQSVVIRTNDLSQLSESLARQVSQHEETSRLLRLASRAIESANDAIIIMDADGVILAANPATSSITGYGPDALLASSAAETLDLSALPGIDDTIYTALRVAGTWSGELWLRHASGAGLPVWMSVSEFRDTTSQVTHYVAVFSDISHRKKSEARIQYLAHHDILTGLPNRVLLQDRFSVARSVASRTGTRMALLYIDVDKFKSVNDSLGHWIGDEYLRAAAKTVQGVLRDSDTLCRMGGDEFIALVSGVDSVADITGIAAKLLESLDVDFQIEDHAVHRTASVGIAICPDDGDDFDDLTSKADTAMYAAKQAGRNTFLFHTEKMNRDLQSRIELETALREALSFDQIFMRYQPQVEIATGRIVGLEALVRWNRPGTGEVVPGSFIPLAEESGLIVAMGQVVVRLVAQQAREWLDAGLAVPVSINVSPVEIWNGKLDTMILDALSETGLPAHLLEVEITESGLIDDTTKTRDMIATLQEHGVRLAIDDFLTGYSNFTYLRRFAVSHLKIDQSFVSHMTPGSENLAIVRAAIQMADILKIPTIAEGVETQAQRELLIEAGCPIGQGYLFARPLLVGEATELLARGYCLPDQPTQLPPPRPDAEGEQ